MDIKYIKDRLSSLRLLYVEDNRDLREKNLDIFSELFYDTKSASNGYEGLKIYKNSDIDLVITDLNMPIMSGFEMLKRIKLIDSNQKCIIYSAYNELDYYSKLKELNINKFLKKPINSSILLDEIIKVVDSSNRVDIRVDWLLYFLFLIS